MKRFLEFRKVENDEELLDRIFAHRYRVFCEKWKFFDSNDYPDGLESDKYDPHAVHIAAITKDSQKVVASLRVVLHSHEGFAMEHQFPLDGDLVGVDKARIGEIGRLAIDSDYRPPLNGDIRQRKIETDIIMGLYEVGCRQSRINKLTHWFSIMTKGLALLLRRRQIDFNQGSPEVECHGTKRALYTCCVDVGLRSEHLRKIYYGDIE